MDLELQIHKTNGGMRIIILEILCVPIFRQNGQFRLFRPKFAQKWILWSELQKSKSESGTTTSKIPHVKILRQNRQL